MSVRHEPRPVSRASTGRPALDRLLVDFDAGAKAALARAVSIVENHRIGFDVLASALHPQLGRARRIGVTGPPGAGKSTLTAQLVRHWRDAGLTVGVVAVDPTSPFTGGALLGDRIRMESVALDAGVFIRSMATRGSLGGLASTTRDVCDVLDAFGFDIILIETVGVGQSELDVARTADTTVVVLVPESGDSIQTLKAGVMEIADLFVVNKADRPGADRLRNDLELMLGLRSGAALRDVPAHHGVDLKALGANEREAMRDAMNPARAARKAADEAAPIDWTPAVLRTVAAQGEGVTEVSDAIARHGDYLTRSGELRHRRRQRLRERVREAVERKVADRLWRDLGTIEWLEARLPELEDGVTAPFHVADALLARSAALVTGVSSADPQAVITASGIHPGASA
jgi:LAO/AO transport system kinase